MADRRGPRDRHRRRSPSSSWVIPSNDRGRTPASRCAESARTPRCSSAARSPSSTTGSGRRPRPPGCSTGLLFLVVLPGRRGWTPGLLAAELRLVDGAGGRVGFRPALVRFVGWLIDILPGVPLVGLLAMRFGRHHQRIGDRMAHTYVVDRAFVDAPPTEPATLTDGTVTPIVTAEALDRGGRGPDGPRRLRRRPSTGGWGGAAGPPPSRRRRPATPPTNGDGRARGGPRVLGARSPARWGRRRSRRIRASHRRSSRRGCRRSTAVGSGAEPIRDVARGDRSVGRLRRRRRVVEAAVSSGSLDSLPRRGPHSG